MSARRQVAGPKQRKPWSTLLLPNVVLCRPRVRAAVSEWGVRYLHALRLRHYSLSEPRFGVNAARASALSSLPEGAWI